MTTTHSWGQMVNVSFEGKLCRPYSPLHASPLACAADAVYCYLRTPTQVDAGEILEEALRSIEEIRSLILPLGFSEVDVRPFRSGAVSSGLTTPVAEQQKENEVDTKNLDVEVYRVHGSAATARGAGS